MITYEEALEIARGWKEEIDNCIEYENAYVFGFSGDDNYVGGYGHTSAVVMKEDGSISTMPEFVANGAGKEIRAFEIPLEDAAKQNELTYVEPIDYFPDEIRKEYKLGEYAEEDYEEE